MTNAITATKNTITAPLQTVFTAESIKEKMAELGLNGLEFDHASFPTISLKSAFEMSSDPNFELKAFDVTVINTQSKHILIDAKDQNFDGIRYSRDGEYSTDGEPLSAIVEAMVRDGRQPVIKRYLDIMVQMHTDKYSGMLAVLSISPTSVSRISGLFYQLYLQGKVQDPSNLQNIKFKVSRGQQRISKGGQTYYLWSFEPLEAVAKVA